MKPLARILSIISAFLFIFQSHAFGGEQRKTIHDSVGNRVAIPFETLENYMNDIRIVAQAVNAEDPAEALISCLESRLAFTSKKVAGIPEDKKVKALFVGHDVYRVYTGDTFQHSQILSAGGINVAGERTGGTPEVSPEQLIVWNPDVIVTLNGTDIQKIITDKKIEDVAAIRNKRVYALPESGWDVASPRALFAVEWLASKFYPRVFQDVDIVAEADAFYNEVFGVNYDGPALADYRAITDMAGRQVKIPSRLNRVATVFPYVTFIQLALGRDDIISAVDNASFGNKRLGALYPAIKNNRPVGSAFHINKESLLIADPDMVFTVTWDRNPDKTQEALGIPVVCVDLNDYTDGIKFMSRVLRSQNKAKRFIDYYDRKMAYINRKTANLANDKKVKVYVASEKGRLSTFGQHSTWQYEVSDAGGINVAQDIKGGGTQVVSMEQVLQWDPDLIIIDNACPDTAKDIYSDPVWQTVTAVKNKQVIVSPGGYLDTWGRPHLESALSRIWLAEMMYPDLMEFDLKKEAMDFYELFYGIRLSDNEIGDILGH